MSANIVITVAGVDITNKVLFDGATFESQMGALPGTFEFTVKDRFQNFSAVTGSEITLDVDGTRLYGGYVTQVTEKFAIPADLTAVPANVQTRQWVLRGVDYNILFDKRVLRNTSDYTHHLGLYAAGSEIGALVKSPLCSDYLDIPSGLDTTTLVTATTTGNPDAQGAWMEQGSLWRKQMDDFARWGIVYYIKPTKQLYVQDVENSDSKWQFSDKPNRLGIPSGYGFKPTVGFREGEFTEDGTEIVNDALVWGGSEWSNGIVFARREDTVSIAARGRWQLAETHFGDLKSQAQVNARANVIVDGTVSGTGLTPSGEIVRGYTNPGKIAKVTWFDHLVPTDPNLGGAKAHLVPGNISTFILYTLGTDAAHPLIMDLPLRTVSITFPNLDHTGKAYVQFEGTFGIQLSDPWWLWKYLRDRSTELQAQGMVSSIAVAGGTGSTGGTTVNYGTTGQFTPTPAPDGSTTDFYIPGNLAYVNGSTEVYVNGLRYFSPANYTESDPTVGKISFTTAPASTDVIYMIAIMAAVSTVPPSTGSADFLTRPASSNLSYSNQSSVNLSNLTFRGPSVGSPAGVGLTLSNIQGSIVLTDLDFADLIGGILLVNCSGSLVMNNLRFRNIGNVGNTPPKDIGSGHGNYIQMGNCRFDGSISNCQFLGGRTEDMLSIFQSGGAGVGRELIIQNNHFQGLVSDTGTARAWVSDSGTGTIIGDGAGAPYNGNVIVRNNTYLTPGQIGIAIIDGPNISVYGNTIYGQQRPLNNVPIGAAFGNPIATVHDNRYYWTNNDGSHPTPYFGAGSITASNNVQDSSINPADLVVNL